MKSRAILANITKTLGVGCREEWEWAAEKKRESTDRHLKGRKETAPKKKSPR